MSDHPIWQSMAFFDNHRYALALDMCLSFQIALCICLRTSRSSALANVPLGFIVPYITSVSTSSEKELQYGQNGVGFFHYLTNACLSQDQYSTFMHLLQHLLNLYCVTQSCIPTKQSIFIYFSLLLYKYHA